MYMKGLPLKFINPPIQAPGGDVVYSLAGIVDGAGISLAKKYSASASNRTSGFEINSDTGSRDLTGDTYLASIKGRLCIGTTQTNASLMGILGTLDVGTVNLSANYFAVRGHLDFWGNCTISGTSFVGAVSAYVENEATTTVGSGQHLDGVDIYQVGAPSVNTAGFNSAINIRASSAASAWRYGIYAPVGSVDRVLMAGNQPGETSDVIADGYGINLATEYSAGNYSFGTSYRLYGIEVNTDCGGVDMTGDVNAGAIKGRHVIGTTQSNAGMCGVVGTLDVKTGVNLTSNYQGVCGVVDFYGTTTIGGSQSHVSAISAVVWNEGTTTSAGSNTGGGLFGIEIIQNSGSPTMTGGINAALHTRGSTWAYGLYLENTARPFYATASLTGATSASKAAFNLQVTDTATISSGYNQGIYCNYTGSGAKTGTAEINVLAVDLTVSGNTPHAFVASLYSAISGSPTIDYRDGIMLYMDVNGSGTVNRQYGLSLEIDNTNAPTESGYIYLYRHGTTSLVDSCIRMERNSGTPSGTATYFIKAPATSAAPFEGGDITSGKTCIAGLRCIIGSTVAVIPLYAD